MGPGWSYPDKEALRGRKATRGFLFPGFAMSSEPALIRTVAFVDGQNLFHSAREAFGHTYPNYDVAKLARAVCAVNGWQLIETRFYTGVPDAKDDPFWHGFWSNKLLAMRRAGISILSRAPRYRNQRVKLPDGNVHTFLAAEEKGVDMRIALDVIRQHKRKTTSASLRESTNGCQSGGSRWQP